ncbi:rhamnogalacturonan acetylesterase [Oceanobacillus kimchii]|uniref:rhamnogalacturonan acetylesterase n=1 Tax=Oceanobacillus kimchii TaxID=746691 RepID=UPI00034778A2|nr:rhamnogalacturonan acetylesterase [Oceanobacillus kimchii]
MNQINLFLAGDSTMATYDVKRAPQMGWGQVLDQYFNEQVKVWNEAMPGRSTKTFIQEGRQKRIYQLIRPGDYLFVQFGHNDSKVDSNRYTEPFTTYKENLGIFISNARDKGAFPVLLTPVQRRNFSINGKIVDKHGNYPLAMRDLAIELAVPLIDITKRSTIMLENIGPELSKHLYMWIKTGDYKYYPDGKEDNTHFTELGANKIAQLVIEGIKDLRLPIAKFIK